MVAMQNEDMIRQNMVEYVKCPICLPPPPPAFLFQVNSGSLVHCASCDLYFVSPRNRTFLDKVEKLETATTLCHAKMLNEVGRIWEFRKYLEAIECFTKPPGSLLDIGCYEGFFLNEARQRGWLSYGVEPNRGGAAHAKDKLGLMVHTGIIENNPFPGIMFNVITLLAVLEHTSDPLSVLTNIRQRMNPNGILFLTVPVIPFYLSLIKERWRMFIGDHYFFFTDKSMSYLLNRSGFSLINQHFVKKSVDISTVMARLNDPWQPHRLGPIARNMVNVINRSPLKLIRLVINLFDTKVYVARAD